MKKIFYRFLYILILLIFTINLLFPLLNIAASTQFKKYIAMGDSIAYGYGLSNRDTQSYSQIVRSKLNIPISNFQNIAVSGMTCQEYYEKITTDESYQNSIKSADLITVSIGSNELLGIAISAVAKVTGISSSDSNFENKAKEAFLNANKLEQLKMLSDIYSFFTSNEIKQKIALSIATYSEYWDKSYKYIKSLNPNATIVATQFYNPYYEMSLLSYDLGGFVDEPIVEMNKILAEKSDSEKNYKIAKIYNDFNTTNPRLTNVNISLTEKKFILDPHPNLTGHKKISTRILDALSTVPSKKDISTLSISEIKDRIYTGKEQTPNVEIKDNNNVLVEDKDYTVVYIDNINIGQAKVSITGIGNYSGNIIKTFNIKQSESKDISKTDISSVEDQTYTGYKVTPIVEIKDNNSILKKDQDYILTYQNNINVGKNAEIIIKGVGNYSGTITKSFKITPKSIAEVNISSIEKQIYTGTEIKPSVQISNGSSKLVLDKDYNVSYNNNVDEGTATIKIDGINNYQGTITKNFEIVKSNTTSSKNIASVSCTEISDKVYTGKLITPEVILKDDSYTLIKNKDYMLSYDNNINIGNGVLTITGIGEYTGTITKNFNIIKKDINYTLVDDIEDQNYTGKEITPQLTITSDYIKLSENTDYTIEYKNNIQAGTAIIKITGINNYTGTMTKTFNIKNINYDYQENSSENYSSEIKNTIVNVQETKKNVSNTQETEKKSNALILPYTGFTSIILSFSIIIIIIFMIINLIKYKRNNI